MRGQEARPSTSNVTKCTGNRLHHRLHVELSWCCNSRLPFPMASPFSSYETKVRVTKCNLEASLKCNPRFMDPEAFTGLLDPFSHISRSRLSNRAIHRSTMREVFQCWFPLYFLRLFSHCSPRLTCYVSWTALTEVWISLNIAEAFSTRLR